MIVLSRLNSLESPTIVVLGLTPSTPAKDGLLSLLWREFRLSNPSSPQLDPQHSLHGPKHLLVRRRSAPLEILDNRNSCVAFCGKILLCHLRLDFIATPHDSLPDLQADRLGFHDLVGAVDFGQVLSFYG
jgi:hypothetical protein